MTRKRLITRIIIRAVIVSILIVLIYGVLDSVGTILNNNIALEQMQPDDTSFVIKELYNNVIRPICSVLPAIILGAGIGCTTYDLIKFYKYKGEN